MVAILQKKINDCILIQLSKFTKYFNTMHLGRKDTLLDIADFYHAHMPSHKEVYVCDV